jgi:hypothetical protein
VGIEKTKAAQRLTRIKRRRPSRRTTALFLLFIYRDEDGKLKLVYTLNFLIIWLTQGHRKDTLDSK